LGTTSVTTSAIPLQVSGLSGVVAIAAGYSHSLALRSDGTVLAWGDNGHGQVGCSTCGSQTAVPTLISNLSGVTAIAAGSSYSLALTSQGVLWEAGCDSSCSSGFGSPVSVQGALSLGGGPTAQHALAVIAPTTTTATATPTNLPIATATNTPVPTNTATATPTNLPTNTPTPTSKPGPISPAANTPVPTSTPTRAPLVPTATPTSSAAPGTSTAQATPVSLAATATPTGQATGAHHLASALSLGALQRSVTSGDTLLIRGRTVPHARIITTLDVWTTKVSVIVSGTRHTRVTRKVVVYRRTLRGTADARGLLRERMPITYMARKPTQATLTLTMSAGHSKATRVMRLTIVPRHRRR
jgi:hypothetical protein